MDVLPSQESAALALLQGLLQKTHAQVRYATILLLDALSKASQVFLDLLAERLQDIVDVLLEWKGLKPKLWGLKAYHLALTKLKDWAADYGESRRPFAIAYRHVTQDRGINIDTLRFGMTPAQEARAAKTKSLRVAKYLQVERDANDKENGITENLVRLEACLEILCPSLIDSKEPIQSPAAISSSYMQVSHQSIVVDTLWNTVKHNNRIYNRTVSVLPPTLWKSQSTITK